MIVSIIVAVAQNGIIGGDNKLLWHISEDLQRFKRITMGCPVIMGRKTFESLGRPLPGRENVVITRNTNYRAEGATVVSSLDAALERFEGEQEQVFIIGGGEIYAQALERADRFYLTVVHNDYEGDTFFPEWERLRWVEQSREYHKRGKDFPHPFEYITFFKTKK